MADFDSIDASEIYELLASETRAEAEKECREIAEIFRIGLINAIRGLLGYTEGEGMRSANAGLITFDSVPLDYEPIGDGMDMIASIAESGRARDLFSFTYNIKFTSKMLYRPGVIAHGKMVSPARSDIVETLSFGFQEGPWGGGRKGYWVARQKNIRSWAVRDANLVVRDYIQAFEKQYPQVSIDDPWGFSNTW